ncbi:hypothetical protein [Hymenobacter glacialis]|uniref:Uncharacterized protein n=1 Tax=Hymenobacter glacialis TaxID=1908236 RepID=A0A1G1TBW4_9BACT|nr:hypothetical protein [Hymenobacter glacialis]OGX88361.1 hypothetical protein BEN48_09760 [Hymenobacter glacialis]
MSNNSNDSNQQSGESKGSQANEGLPKGAGDLPLLTQDEATQDRLEQEALDAGLLHPNRNLDKPELDSPTYGSH